MFYGVVHGLLHTFDQSANVLGAPRSYARTKLHRPRKPAGSDAVPPRRFADRDWLAESDDAGQPNKAGRRDFVLFWHGMPSFVSE